MKAIYKIQSKARPNKIYIGSALRFEQRKKTHLYSLKIQKHKNRILQSHFNKYGIEDLVFTVIEEVFDAKDLISREQYYIDTLKPTFNICFVAGSSYGVRRTDEYKAKMSKSKKGSKHRPECNIEKSERQKGKERKGVPHTQESKNKIKANHASKRPIVKICLCGNTVKEFESILAAAREENISPPSISSCLRGITEASKGFKWKYK